MKLVKRIAKGKIGSVVPATEEHVGGIIAAGFREADLLELSRAGTRPPEESLYEAFIRSDVRYTGLINDTPVMMFGVTPFGIMGQTGIPWMLGTKELETCWRTLGILSKRGVNLFKRDYKYLMNYVDSENEGSVNWLKWLGFTVYPEKLPTGLNGGMFYKFEWEDK